MPRKKPMTAADCVDPAALLAPVLDAALQVAEQPVLDALQSMADAGTHPSPALRYSAEDMEKLDQFAIGLLRDGTGAFDAADPAFVNRVRQAYLRAEVMLTIRKEIAALEA